MKDQYKPVEKLKGPDSLCVALPPSSHENLRSTT